VVVDEVALVMLSGRQRWRYIQMMTRLYIEEEEIENIDDDDNDSIYDQEEYPDVPSL
jgi:hypothetical protein